MSDTHNSVSASLYDSQHVTAIPFLNRSFLVGLHIYIHYVHVSVLIEHHVHTRNSEQLSEAMIMLMGGPQFVEIGHITEYDYLISKY